MEFKLDEIIGTESDANEDAVSVESFVDTIQKSILISSRNVILYSQAQHPLTDIQNICEENLKNKSNFSVCSNESLESLHQSTPFSIDPFFIISHPFLKKILPFPPRIETKLKTSKLSPESLFELGRQQAYLNLNQEAFNTFEKLNFCSETEKSVLWKTCLLLRYPKLMTDEKVNCCNKRKIKRPEFRFKFILNKLKRLPESVESFWLMMDLACSSMLQVGRYLEPWQYYAGQILKIDKLYGYLAFGTVYLKLNFNYGQEILHKLAETYPSHPYSYIVLWEYYYNKKEFFKSFDIIAECFLRVNDCKYSNFFNLVLVLYIKSSFRIKRYYTALELLQNKYEESQNNLFYLYLFGKFCIKSRVKKLFSAGMSALKEVLRWIKNYSKINYWYGKVCYKTGRIFKAQKHFHKVSLTLNRNQMKYSIKIQRMLGKIEKAVKELTIFKEKLETEKVGIIFKGQKTKYHNLLKISQAECYLKQKMMNRALELLRKIPNFDAFLLILEKIVTNLSVSEGKLMLVRKIEILHNSTKVPLFEFIESCILYSDYLAKNSCYEEALTILQRILNFYPNFPHNLPYVKYCKDFWISITLLGFKNVIGLSLQNKKNLVMKAVRESVREGFLKIFEETAKKKKKSLSLRDELFDEEKCKIMEKQNSGQGVVDYGVYTDGAVLMKIAEVLEKMKDRTFESKEALQDFLVICRKPIDKTKTIEIMENFK